MKLVKAFLDFWQKDIINKLIVLVLLALMVAACGFVFMLFATPQGEAVREAANAYLPSLRKEAVPTFDVNIYLTAQAAPPAVAATPFVMPTFTPFVPLPAPTLELPTPLPTIILPSPTQAAPTQALPQPTKVQPLSSDFPCLPANPRQIGRVIEILDGNTARILVKDSGLIYTVRYLDISAPTDKIMGDKAKQKNGELVYGKVKEVALIAAQTDKDDRGRLLRYVLVEKTFVNLELIKVGLGFADDASAMSCAQIFKEAEQAAKSAGFGMWAPGSTPKP